MIDLRAYTVLRCDHTGCTTEYIAPENTANRGALVLKAMDQGWTVSNLMSPDGDQHYCPHHPADTT